MKKNILFTHLFTILILSLFLYISTAVTAKSISPHVRIIDSRDITWDILEHRMDRNEILVERQISRIMTLKDGGSGIIINGSKKNTVTEYYGQISGLKIGYYVTTYYIYNPCTNQWDDAVLWYSLVTKKPSQARFCVISSFCITKSMLIKRRKNHQIILAKKTLRQKKGKRNVLSIIYTLYNPDNNKTNDKFDICEYRFENGNWKVY